MEASIVALGVWSFGTVVSIIPITLSISHSI